MFKIFIGNEILIFFVLMMDKFILKVYFNDMWIFVCFYERNWIRSVWFNNLLIVILNNLFLFFDL